MSTPKQAAKIILFGLLIYLWMTVLCAQNILPGGEPIALHDLFSILTVQLLTFALFGVVSVYISKRCKYFDQHDQDVKNTAQTLLTHLDVATLLLDHQEDILYANPAADSLPNSSRKKDRKELFSHMVEASDKMNTILQNFIDFAELSPTDLLSIIKLDSSTQNKGYIGRLSTIAKGFEHGQNFNRGR